MWAGVDSDVELYASGVVVEDDGEWAGGQSLGEVRWRVGAGQGGAGGGWQRGLRMLLARRFAQKAPACACCHFYSQPGRLGMQVLRAVSSLVEASHLFPLGLPLPLICFLDPCPQEAEAAGGSSSAAAAEAGGSSSAAGGSSSAAAAEPEQVQCRHGCCPWVCSACPRSMRAARLRMHI